MGTNMDKFRGVTIPVLTEAELFSMQGKTPSAPKAAPAPVSAPVSAPKAAPVPALTEDEADAQAALAAKAEAAAAGDKPVPMEEAKRMLENSNKAKRRHK
jgi:hypothetical protein